MSKEKVKADDNQYWSFQKYVQSVHHVCPCIVDEKLDIVNQQNNKEHFNWSIHIDSGWISCSFVAQYSKLGLCGYVVTHSVWSGFAFMARVTLGIHQTKSICHAIDFCFVRGMKHVLHCNHKKDQRQIKVYNITYS